MRAGWIKAWIAGVLLANGFAGELRVAAAASLAETVTEVAAAYQAEHGTKVTPVFAGSNVLARQIEQGAPVDVFISADEATMAGLAKASLVREVKPLLSNALVVVIPTDSDDKVTEAKDLLGFRRIAIGDPSAVPAGIYARKWLAGQGLWKSLGPKCVGGENVRAALVMVESGNVDAAIVYRTDAGISKKVKVAWTVPAAEAPAIVYPVATCTAARESDEAKRFTAFLTSEPAAAIFKARGFGLAAAP